MSISYLLDKLYTIDQQLGGTAKVNQKSKSADSFDILKDVLLQNLHMIKKKLQEKSKQSSPAEVIKLDYQIKEKFNDCEKILTQMNDALRKQQKDKKFSEKEIQKRFKLYESYRAQVQHVKSLIFEDYSDQSLSGPPDTHNLETLTAQRQQLIGKERDRPQELSYEEKQAIERWKQESARQDEMLDQINVGLETWKKQALKMNEAIDTTITQINNIDKEVEITNRELTSQNTQLKKLVKQFGAPQNCCINMTLLLVLIGLATMIYYFSK